MAGSEDVFQQAMDRGHSAAWDQMWEQAASFYRQALEQSPKHPKALTSLGLALYELQRYEEALQCYSQAAAISPDDPLPFEKVAQLSERSGNREYVAKASLHAADLYLKRQEVEKAIENLSRAARIDVENIAAHSKLAVLYERLGRKQPAVVEYLAVASLFQHRGETEKAVQAVNRALQVSPESSEAHQSLDLLRASRPLPKPSRSHAATGPLGAARGQKMGTPQAAARPGAGVDPVTEARDNALAALAGLLFEGPESEPAAPQAARRGLQSLVRGTSGSLFSRQADPTKIMLHLSLAVDQQARGQEAQAAEELERAVSAGLEHAAAHFDLGLLHAGGDHPESGLQNLQFAVKHADYALGARLLLGQSLRRLGRLDEAALEYLEALKLADARVVPDHQADALLQLYEPLIEAEAQQTDPEAKSRLCDNVVELLLRADWRERLTQARKDLPVEVAGGPPMPLGEILTEARSSKIIESIAAIHQLARAGHLRSAMEEVFYALLYAPTYLPLHIYMGELLLQQDRLPEAVEKFSVVAQTYSVRSETRRAIELLQRIIRAAPMDLDARNRLIEQLLASGQVVEAVREYVGLADVYYDLADLDRARKAYGEALRIAHQSNLAPPIKVQILHQMADIDLQRLDWRQALRVYEQIRDLEPGDQRSRTELVQLNIRLGQESQAMAELKNYLSYLSGLHQTDQAISFVEALVSENPGHLTLERILSEMRR
jgi:tetratricopeptide (TPR) repeat protein